MPYVGDSRSIHGPGFLPLQDHGFRQRDTPLDMRSCVLAMRITGRETGVGQLGQWIYDKESVGDIIGSSFWPQDLGASNILTLNPDKIGIEVLPPRRIGGGGAENKDTIQVGIDTPGARLVGSNETRPMGAWRLGAWPVISMDPKQEVGGRGTVGTGHGFPVFEAKDPSPRAPKGQTVAQRAPIRMPTNIPFLPIQSVAKDGEWLEDMRFAIKEFRFPGKREKAPDQSRIPTGTVGLMVPANFEGVEVDLMFPIDRRLIAPNQRTDPELGTLVCDIREETYKIDEQACARLQSIFRVVKGRKTRPFPNPAWWSTEPTVAIQMGASGIRDDSLGGLFFYPVGGVSDSSSARGKPLLCAISDEFGGPMNAGFQADHHYLGQSGEGYGINSMHLNIDTALFVSETPLSFFREPEPGEPGFDDAIHNERIEQTFRRDGPLATYPMKFFGHPGTGPFPTECQMVYDPSQFAEYLHPSGFGIHYGQWKWQTWVDTTDSDNPYGDQPTRVRPPSGPTIGRPGQGLGAGFAPIGGGGGGGYRTETEQAQVDEEEIRKWAPMMVKSPLGTPRTFAMTTREISHPSVIFRPQFYHRDRMDYRYWRRPSREEAGYCLECTPITARLDGYGKQGSSNSEWAYTHTPRKGGHRYGKIPTAWGGLCLLPAELSLEDIRDATWDPASSAISRAFLVIPPSARLAFGLPSTDDGQVKVDGIVMSPEDVVSPTSGLWFRRVDAAGTLTRVATVHKLGFAVGAQADFGGGDRAISIQNAATVPASNPTGGGVIYAEGGALKYRGSGGTVTTLGAA